MKNFIFILLAGIFLVSCKDPEIDSENKSKEELLTANAWQLEKFTDPNGKTISDGALNSTAKLLYFMIFEFKSNLEVRGIDKTSKGIINRGTWSYRTDGSEIIDIDIVGFSGEFEIINISKKTLTLEAKTGDNLTGVGPEIYLVFSPADI